MTSDTYERAGVNQYRFICAFVGQLVVTGLALTLAKYFGGGDKAMGFQYTLVLFGCIERGFLFHHLRHVQRTGATVNRPAQFPEGRP